MDAPGTILGVEARAIGYAPTANHHVELELDPDPDDLVLRLVPGRRITGRVIEGSTELPVEGAFVRRLPEPQLFDSRGRGESLARTDVEGRFALEELPPGETTLEIRFAGWEEPIRDGPFEVPASGPDLDRLVVLGVGGRIGGAVLGDAGEPIGGVEVVLQSINVPGPDFQRTATTSPRGVFFFEDLPDGVYRVLRLVTEDGYPRILVGSMGQLEGGGTLEVILQTGGSASITGTLVDDAGLPPLVRVMAGPGPASMGPEWTSIPLWGGFARDGAFTFPGLPPGDYMLMAAFGEDDEGPSPLDAPPAGAMHAGQIQVTIGEGEAAEVTITLVKME